MAATPVLRAREIVHRYRDRVALDGFTLEVPPGTIFGLLGPNGSGKSTFLSLVAAQEQPQAGDLSCWGEPPRRAFRRRIGVVFQEGSLDPLMTSAELLQLFARLYGLPRGLARSRVRALLEQVGLAGRARDRIATLSGGMRRRLELARALLHEPELLVLDEPTTGIDAEEREAIWELLAAARERGATVLFATNDLVEADRVCDRAAFIRAGRVVAVGTPEELKRGLRAETVAVTWECPREEELAQVESWDSVGEVAREGDTVLISTDDARTLIPRLFELAGRRISAVSIHPTTLADAYFAHVGRRAHAEARA